mmetsp:Transcript_8202/g.22256  ORF Transcript_8202/g.22256 Transcript_8202/m.22256 type:complete len:200 (-) Transcript_8202:183-782(-)
MEQILNDAGIGQACNLLCCCRRGLLHSDAMLTFHTELELGALPLHNLTHKPQHVVEDLNGIGEDTGVVRRRLEVLHDPGQMRHDVILYHVLCEDLAAIPRVRVLGLHDQRYSLHLLRQCTKDDDQMRGVNIGLLPVLPQPRADELQHVKVDGPLDGSDVDDRHGLVRLPSLLNISHVVVPVKLQRPGDKVQELGPVEFL